MNNYETSILTIIIYRNNLRAVIFTWICPAFSLVITFSMAAGINISHGSYMRFSPLYGSAPGKPTIVPVSIRYSSNS